MEEGRQDAAGPPSTERASVQEAAELLGTTVDAIRKRVQRDTIAHEKAEDGRVWILLDADRTRHVTDRDTTGQRQDSAEAVAEVLREQNAYLREQLRREQDAHAEARRIIAGLVSRVPQLEAPPDAPGSPERGGAGEGGGDVSHDPQTGARRPWWRRMFGR